jgi:LmbE family N-acetylglucosaminyl deacetylase
MAKRTLMAIGAHADDIELNVGGTLVKYREMGYEIVYVMSTNNMSGGWSKLRPDGMREMRTPPFNEIMPQRKLEAAVAAKFFGTEAIHLDHPQRHYMGKDGQVVELRYGNPKPDCVPSDTPTILTAHEDKSCVRKLAELMLKHQPEAVMTHGPIMVDMEHVGTCMLVTKAYLMAKESGFDGMLLHWSDLTPPIFGDTFSRWDTFIDINHSCWKKKMQAIALHACQIPNPSKLDFPPRAETCGCLHAETFTICNQGGIKSNCEFTAEILEHKK